MKKSIYSLRISCSSVAQFDKVSKLLDTALAKQIENTWCLEVEESESDEYFDFINRFLDILEGKYEQLECIGISKKDISIWLLYEYEEQCNMEFLPVDLKRLGISGISLCISCWES